MNDNSKKITQIALLVALGTILFFIAIPMPVFSFLKLDLSDLSVLIAGELMGVEGILFVSILKSLLYFILTGPNIISLIGVGSALLFSLTLGLSFYYLRKKLNLWLSIFIASLLVTIVMILANYFVILPSYTSILNFKLPTSTLFYLGLGVVPFNILKSVILIILDILIVRNNRWFKKS